MGKLKPIILFSFLLMAFHLNAQEADIYVVNIKGKIISDDGGEVVPYAHVINPRVHGGTTSNADGMFSISMLLSIFINHTALLNALFSDSALILASSVVATPATHLVGFLTALAV